MLIIIVIKKTFWHQTTIPNTIMQVESEMSAYLAGYVQRPEVVLKCDLGQGHAIVLGGPVAQTHASNDVQSAQSSQYFLHHAIDVGIVKAGHLSTNQSINQSIRQSGKQSIKQSIRQSINKAINQSIRQSGKQSSNQSGNQSINKAISQSGKQSINQGRSVNK